MLKSIVASSSRDYYYLVQDDNFYEEYSLLQDIRDFSKRDRIGKIITIVDIYSRRKLNVPQNLAKYYSQYKYGPDYYRCQNTKAVINYDKKCFDEYFPNLEYGKKYYNCIINQVDKLYAIGHMK